MEEGAADHFFEKDANSSNIGDKAVGNKVEEEREIPHEVLRATFVTENTVLVRMMCFMVDDNDKPVPENLPESEGQNTASALHTWEWSGAN